MRLRALILAAYPEQATRLDVPDTVVTGVTQDASRVTPGSVFVARRGARFDGHDFLPAVVEAGAVLVVGSRNEPPLASLAGVPYLTVEDDLAAVARLAAALHGWPSRKLRVIGVTGTDGKTTTSALLWWTLQGHAPSALFSTAMVRLGDAPGAPVGHFTTPEADVVQDFLATAVDDGSGHVVLESSSHGLALQRLEAVAYDLAVVTNLTPEHLDFHGTFEAYRAAKATLVERAPHAVLNRDDASFDTFAAKAASVTSYGERADADWRLLDVESQPAGLRARLRSPEGDEHVFDLPLPGRFNAWNAAAAIAAAVHEGVPVELATARLATFPGVPGRMERIQAEPFVALVDFAHTPAALTKALDALNPTGRRIVLVGAAGERDPAKRAPLGEVAVRHADVAVLTEEDSRSEDVTAILSQMREGAVAAGGVEGSTFFVIPDRREAIRVAVGLAEPGDVLLLAGKGHESTLERSGETLPWSEREELQRALSERLEGSATHTLPASPSLE